MSGIYGKGNEATVVGSKSRAVLTNGHTGHVPRAPGFFFLFDGSPTGCGEIIFLTNYLIVDATA